ncbi:MAG: hypothetical protein PHX57_14335 [Desulfobulbaceae bacterium]|nr:hypothetical protein [Desulfobulbaceae bacterium]
MGKFAAVYPLPGGEQLLAMVVHGEPGKEPEIRYITEIMGSQVTAAIPIRTKDGQRFHSHQEAVANAGAAITAMTDEEVLTIRKYMVRQIRDKEAQHANGG